MNSSPVTEAIRNNVHWYDVMCGLHGSPGERHDAYWVNRGAVPPYMSKLITLTVEDAEAQLEAIRSLVHLDPTACFSVKDAHQNLDLSGLGFEVLFQASWIHRRVDLPAPSDAAGVAFRVVETPDELDAWERAWRGTRANVDARERPRVFLPELLQNPSVRLLLGLRDGAPVATAALNRSEGVVGLSNVFSDVEDAHSLFPGCVRLAQELYPGLPLVGYQRGEGLSAAQAAGFETVGRLTVWNRVPAATQKSRSSSDE